MKYSLLFFILCFPVFVFSQKYDYNWLNGLVRPGLSSNFLINFNKISPQIYVVNTDLDLATTYCSISDYWGNSENLLYTNGCSLKFRENVMSDFINLDDYWCGYDTLMNNPQGIFGVPIEGTSKILLFSYSTIWPATPTVLGYNCQVKKFIYHTFDLGWNNGEGALVSKDQVLLEGCFQRAVACRHSNGRDWWILLADNLQNRFYRWLLTPNGLEGPVEQEIENPTIGNDVQWGIINPAWTEFSANGSKLLINQTERVTVVYDFDRCTGLLSNLVSLPRNSLYNFSAVFSPNGNYLYTVDDGGKILLQYDLLSPDIIGSKDTVAVWDGFTYATIKTTIFTYMQHGPDGKIYIWAGDTRYMHVIEFPNRRGEACQVRQRAINLPAEVFAANLYYPNYRLGPIDGSACDSLGIDNHPMAVFRYAVEDTLSPYSVTFTDASSYEPTAWHWQFGDGAVSQDTNPVHTYPGPGTYHVCMVVSNVYSADTLCRDVIVGTVDVHDLPVLPLVAVRPNPFSDYLQVSLPAQIPGISPWFGLYDLYGRPVYSGFLREFDSMIPVSRLRPGMYRWHIWWGSKLEQSGKVMKVE
jgi:PKD repeat protein